MARARVQTSLHLAEIALAHGREVREVLPVGRQWQVTGCGRQETGKVPETG